MDVSCGEIGEIFLDCGERPGTFAGSKSVGISDSLFNGGRVESPQFQRVVHSARNDPATLQIEIGAEDFVSVAFDSAENGDALIRSDIPESKGVIF